jgi:hypothetical protein
MEVERAEDMLADLIVSARTINRGMSDRKTARQPFGNLQAFILSGR